MDFFLSLLLSFEPFLSFFFLSSFFVSKMASASSRRTFPVAPPSADEPDAERYDGGGAMGPAAPPLPPPPAPSPLAPLPRTLSRSSLLSCRLTRRRT